MNKATIVTSLVSIIFLTGCIKNNSDDDSSGKPTLGNSLPCTYKKERHIELNLFDFDNNHLNAEDNVGLTALKGEYELKSADPSLPLPSGVRVDNESIEIKQIGGEFNKTSKVEVLLNETFDESVHISFLEEISEIEALQFSLIIDVNHKQSFTEKDNDIIKKEGYECGKTYISPGFGLDSGKLDNKDASGRYWVTSGVEKHIYTLQIKVAPEARVNARK